MRRERGTRRETVATVGSAAIHALAIGLAWGTSAMRPEPLEFVTYQIELVSPPPARTTAPPAPEPEPPAQDLVVERPQPDPVPEPAALPPPEARLRERPPERREEPARPPAPAPEPERREPERERPRPPPPDETAEPARESGEGINVRLEGLRRDYPQYYENIIRQIARCFRWSRGGSWVATVSFVIHRDGSAHDTELLRRSGDRSFDLEALGAIECAGGGRFGALPEDLPFEQLPISFEFRPSGGGSS